MSKDGDHLPAVTSAVRSRKNVMRMVLSHDRHILHRGAYRKAERHLQSVRHEGAQVAAG
jgi:hypothetical protein